MRDIRTYVKYHKELTGVKNELDSAALKGLSKGLTDDLVWRAGFLHRDLDYWELVTPDFQRQLSSGQGVHVDPLVSQLAVLNVEEQGISKLNFYKRAQIVRYPFRCFHRSDGKHRKDHQYHVPDFPLTGNQDFFLQWPLLAVLII